MQDPDAMDVGSLENVNLTEADLFDIGLTTQSTLYSVSETTSNRPVAHPTTDFSPSWQLGRAPKQLLSFCARLSEEQDRLQALKRELEDYAATLVASEAASGHSSNTMRRELSAIISDQDSTKDLTLEQRHDLLRAKLMDTGIWYDEVDAVIHALQGGAYSRETSSEGDLRLMPEDVYKFGLHKATCLDPGLGLDYLTKETQRAPEADVKIQTSNDNLPASEDNTTHKMVRNSNGRFLPKSKLSSSGASRSQTAAKRTSILTGSLKVSNISVDQRDSVNELARSYLHTITGNPRKAIVDEDVFNCLQQPNFTTMLSSIDASRSHVQTVNLADMQAKEKEILIQRSNPAPPLPPPSLVDQPPIDAEARHPTQASSFHAGLADLQNTVELAPVSEFSPDLPSLKSKRGSHMRSDDVASPDLSIHTSALTGKKRTRGGYSAKMHWTDEEEDVLIQILSKIWQRDLSPTKMWSTASSQLAEKGYDRTSSSLQQRWSLRLRLVCMNRKYTWISENTDPSEVDESIGRLAGLSEQKTASPQRMGMSQATGGRRDKEIADCLKRKKALGRPEPIKSLESRRDIALRNARSGERTVLRHFATSSKRVLQSLGDENFQPTHSWTGASHDVLNVVWSPNGDRYAAGGAALMDERNILYNRPNNLLLGDVRFNIIRELPDHHITRQSSADAVDTLSKIYTSISALHWSQSGCHLYTASYDQTVKVWNMQNDTIPKCTATLQHPASVIVMAVAKDEVNLIATGTDSSNKSLRAYHANSDGSNYSTLSLPAQRGKSTFIDSPNCLRFGASPANQNYLAAGFGCQDTNEDGSASRLGFLGLWRFDNDRVTPLPIVPRSHAVFDIAWASDSTLLATGNSVAFLHKKSSETRSSVRIYSVTKGKAVTECECPALDMNDVTFCPYNQNYVTASCTDGATYVWDRRRPDKMLHKLGHGPPACELDHFADREITDPGVRFAEWGSNCGQLYTGASDGVIKYWDIRRSTEDALIKDVASFGIELMCGRLSPDRTSLLVGDASGSIHVLSKTCSEEDEIVRDIEFIRAPSNQSDRLGAEEPDSKTSRQAKDAAEHLVTTGQIVIHPTYGPGKGSAYAGPFAKWARPAVPEEELPFTDLLPEIRKTQRDQTSYGLKRSQEDKIHRKDKKPVKMEPPRYPTPSKNITKSSEQAAWIDLTGDDNSRETLIKNTVPLLTVLKCLKNIPLTGSDQTSGNCGVIAEGYDKDEVVDGDDEDDFWFPPNWSVDANLSKHKNQDGCEHLTDS